jgi:NAD-dependent SIR2 family protein deacetylase
MFSTRNGLYQRACKRFGISDGKKLFTWRFYDRQRTDVTSFFVDIHKEAAKAQPGAGHRAVAQLQEHAALLRHYTMNVDGLAMHVRSYCLRRAPLEGMLQTADCNWASDLTDNSSYAAPLYSTCLCRHQACH